MEHVLELQELDTPEVMDGGHGGGGGSDVSLLICGGGSVLSLACD
jgi:hypothetical protein